MKKIFTLEIECLDSIRSSMEEEFQDEILHAFRIGLNEYFGCYQAQNCSLRIVEQNHGTPESINKEALNLLSKAVERIKFYCEKAYGSSKESLAEQIEEYLIEIQR